MNGEKVRDLKPRDLSEEIIAQAEEVKQLAIEIEEKVRRSKTLTEDLSDKVVRFLTPTRKVK
jgi:hypothetical protein